MTLSKEIDRCPGVGCWDEGKYHWREGCEDCARRTEGETQMEPPPIIAFECEYWIPRWVN